MEWGSRAPQTVCGLRSVCEKEGTRRSRVRRAAKVLSWRTNTTTNQFGFITFESFSIDFLLCLPFGSLNQFDWTRKLISFLAHSLTCSKTATARQQVCNIATLQHCNSATLWPLSATEKRLIFWANLSHYLKHNWNTHTHTHLAGSVCIVRPAVSLDTLSRKRFRFEEIQFRLHNNWPHTHSHSHWQQSQQPTVELECHTHSQRYKHISAFAVVSLILFNHFATN